MMGRSTKAASITGESGGVEGVPAAWCHGMLLVFLP